MAQEIIILAGPNGAGKTTFARAYLPREAQCLNFINADLIAAGLSPFQPETAAIRAGRLMLKEIERSVQEGESFAFETTLSGRSYARLIPEWCQMGFRIKLVYLMLNSVEIALERVRSRVRQGGHHVPDDVVTRRYHLGWVNFQKLYRPLVHHWVLFNNSGSMPVLISRGDNT